MVRKDPQARLRQQDAEQATDTLRCVGSGQGWHVGSC